MTKLIRLILVTVLLGFTLLSCSHEDTPISPDLAGKAMTADKTGTETLGPPGIPIATGSGLKQSGVGLSAQPKTLTINVPGTVKQALLYWSGGDPTVPYEGDNTISFGGVEVPGTLIGGPRYFFNNYRFLTYRADVTEMVSSGDNSFEVSGMDFDPTSQENNGAGLLVIYDDGTEADIELFDGQDLAYFDFDAPLDITVPQIFGFDAATTERTAKLVIFAGSVGANRPNEITVTIDGNVQSFVNEMASTEGELWDALSLFPTVPAGADQMTVQLISTPTVDPAPRGASMSWVVGGLAIAKEVLPASLGDFVWEDTNKNGIQDPGEPGIPGVTVKLWKGCPPAEVFAQMTTGANGDYLFTGLEPGDYTVEFVEPDGYDFTLRDQGGDDAKDSDTDPATGITGCYTLAPGETNLTVDAGLYVPCATLGDYVWNDEDMDGVQNVHEIGIPGVTVKLWTGCPADVVVATTTTDANGLYLFDCIDPGEYTVQFVLPDGYEFSPPNFGYDNTDSDAMPPLGTTDCISLDPGETDLTVDAGMFMPTAIGCRVTGGCKDSFAGDAKGIDVYTCGGQAGAPTESQPQPRGEWTHTQGHGPSGSFTFHAGTSSAPAGTEIDWIECMDEGWCRQARPAPAKQIDFAGVGTFKNMKPNVPHEISDHVVVGESLHWFEVNIDDLGEPGSGSNVPDPAPQCDPLGFGRNGGEELADCDCQDFYRIRIHEGPDESSPVMYEVYGYIDKGNFQIHPPIGNSDSNRSRWESFSAD
jgi:hypothetical protein